MILTDKDILAGIESESIVIQPFDKRFLGSNSYDVHLGKNLAMYNDRQIDAKADNEVVEMIIPEEGFTMLPGNLYLGVTEEYTESHKHVPFLEGKSSTGRLGISVHATAGKGDIGFCNHWTLEISVICPVKVYAGMPIAQLIYFEARDNCINPYYDKESAKYIEVTGKPMASMMFKNFK